MLEEGIDYLVLGCTHYPYLIPILKEMLPEEVQIIDSGEAVARQTKSILNKNNILNESENLGNYQFYSNSNIATLKGVLSDVKVPHRVTALTF
jgi:glutamate racemase